jgi:hypothetical protein
MKEDITSMKEDIRSMKEMIQELSGTQKTLLEMIAKLSPK